MGTIESRSIIPPSPRTTPNRPLPLPNGVTGIDIISNFVKGQDFIYGLLNKAKKETPPWLVLPKKGGGGQKK
jgi:hypothetical protein